jgi:uncharacterized RDD family membrane protein YckC
MEQPLPDSELVVATPERVSFGYQVAGLGTRAIAQLLDLLIVLGILIALSIAAGGVAAFTNNALLADLILIIGGFIVVFGYFWASEAMWSGQTLGKKAFRLRAVGDRGEPLTFLQAGIRNVVRIVDFLPYGYGVGAVVLFINGKGKRLGDLAAGTIVVKDSDHVWLWQLPGARPSDLAGSGQVLGAGARQPQIPQSPPGYPPYPPPPPPLQPVAAAPLTYAPASQADAILRRLDPELRRFIGTYARRRPQLTLDLRVQLAASVQQSLRHAMPDMFEQQGPLATLDYLGDLERS